MRRLISIPARSRSLHHRTIRSRVALGRVRAFAMRYRLARRSLALTMAAVAGWSVVAVQADAQATIERLGPTASVAVASHDLPLGHVLTADDVELTRWPVGLIPAVVTELDVDAAIGRSVTAPIHAGEAIHPVRLAPVGLRGIAALLPADTNGVAIDRSGPFVAVSVGNRVDLGSVAIDGGANSLATDLLVVAVDDQRLTVAVPVERSAEVALAALRNEVTVAVRGG